MKLFCHNCNEDVEINLYEEKKVYKVKDSKYEIIDTVTMCSKCGEEVFNKDKDSKILEKLNNMYRREHNLLLPEEIKKIREMYDLTQREFSKLLGFGDVTISRYENGAIQDIANNNLMILCEKPSNVQRLIVNNNRLSDDIKQKIYKFIKSIPSIFDIAYLFINRFNGDISNMKLQKLCYFFWRDSILNNGKYLDIKFEAWKHGPVNKNLYNKFQSFGDKNIPLDQNEIICCEFDKMDLDIFENIIKKYGQFDAKYLSRISHHEEAWKKANPYGTYSQEIIDYRIVREQYLN